MPIIKDHEGPLAPNLDNRRNNRCTSKIINPKNQGGRRKRKGASKHKKRYVHPDAVDARTNIIATAVKVKTEFNVKVEAKTEVKIDDI